MGPDTDAVSNGYRGRIVRDLVDDDEPDAEGSDRREPD